MIPIKEMFTPVTWKEAFSLLKEYPAARVMLGGTDLIVQLNKKILKADAIVDLTGLPGIYRVNADDGFYYFGAGITHSYIAKWATEHKAFSALSEAAHSIGTPQVRNIATWVGNLCNAVPSADMGAPSLVFGAEVEVCTENSSRWLPVKDLFFGPKKTSLKHGEIIRTIRLPKETNDTVSAYCKFGPRNASDLAYVGVCAKVVMEEERVKDIAVALGAVAPTPILVSGLEAYTGIELTDKTIIEIARLAAMTSRPITDFRSTEEYRRHIVEIETKRALMRCREQLVG